MAKHIYRSDDEDSNRGLQSARFETDLREYVNIFQTSSNRARNAFYIVIVATTLVFIANYNLGPQNFPVRRLRTFYTYSLPDDRASAADSRADTRADNRAGDPGEGSEGNPMSATQNEIPEWLFGGDSRRLKIAREEYLKQFISRFVLTSTPIPGVSIDVNDLGLLGGLSLTCLMIVLTLCILREHENLYLALYKARELCLLDKNHSHGDSNANLLYHALAMGQVVNSPPTLARWQRGYLDDLGIIIFFSPALCYCWIVKANHETQIIADRYGVDSNFLMGMHYVILIALMILCTLVSAVSSSMSERWRRAFFRINPGREHVRQMSLCRWLKLKNSRESRSEARLFSSFVDKLEVAKEPNDDDVWYVWVEESISIARKEISTRELRVMKEHIFDKGQVLAQEWCKDSRRCELVIEGKRFMPEKSRLDRTRKIWTVAGNFEFKYEVVKKRKNESELALVGGAGKMPALPAGPLDEP